VCGADTCTELGVLTRSPSRVGVDTLVDKLFFVPGRTAAVLLQALVVSASWFGERQDVPYGTIGIQGPCVTGDSNCSGAGKALNFFYNSGRTVLFEGFATDDAPHQKTLVGKSYVDMLSAVYKVDDGLGMVMTC